MINHEKPIGDDQLEHFKSLIELGILNILINTENHVTYDKYLKYVTFRMVRIFSNNRHKSSESHENKLRLTEFINSIIIKFEPTIGKYLINDKYEKFVDYILNLNPDTLKMADFNQNEMFKLKFVTKFSNIDLTYLTNALHDIYNKLDDPDL